MRFSRHKKKDRQRHGKASGQYQLKTYNCDYNDTAKIQRFNGCRKSQDRKRPIFLFFFFFLEK